MSDKMARLPRESPSGHRGLVPGAIAMLVIVVVAAMGGCVVEAVVLRPITLTKHALYGWEGHDLNMLIQATARIGTITRYELDVNNDGVWDFAAEHDPKVGGVLAFDLPLLNLLGNPADNGSYTATVRIHSSFGQFRDFPAEIAVGNVPPEIIFGENMSGTIGSPFVLEVATKDPGPDTVECIVVDWGDGEETTMEGPSGEPGHTYSQPGLYTIRATVTDEDGSYWAELSILIEDAAVTSTP